ncbi:MAG: RnfABCDGE type electron transport complex subunit D [Chromatiales bacterium]|jgi:Na+-transporting NADH:ubiquinone oxidoreductase subunit B
MDEHGHSNVPKTLRATWHQVVDPVTEAFRALSTGSRSVTERASHIRDAVSVRRIFAVYLVALMPLILFGLYNTGLQIHLAIADGADPLENWRTDLMLALGFGEFDPDSIPAAFVHGALYFLPLLLASYLAALVVGLIFSVVRQEGLSSGAWIFTLLFTLILPPTTPIWQAAVAMAFGTVIGKEIFGGTGRNVVHPMLLSWAFLYVSYPATLAGEGVWVPVDIERPMLIDIAAEEGLAGLAEHDWVTALIGLSPGPVGVPSAALCFLGVGALLLAQLVSWRVVVGFIAGSAAAAFLFAGGDPANNPMFGIPVHWHMVIGGWAFGMAFIVTDPVTASHTRTGRWVYGFLAGAFVIVVRVLNPVQLDGTAIALLFMSLFAALIDHFVIRANVMRRRARYGSQ